MKQSVTTEIEVPEGYTATGEFRMPQPYEYYLNSLGEAKTDCRTNYPAFILKKNWVWPKWLKVRYIAKDYDGSWYGYEVKPRFNGSCWLPSGFIAWLRPSVVDIEFPDVDSANSLIKNPHIE